MTRPVPRVSSRLYRDGDSFYRARRGAPRPESGEATRQPEPPPPTAVAARWYRKTRGVAFCVLILAIAGAGIWFTRDSAELTPPRVVPDDAIRF